MPKFFLLSVWLLAFSHLDSIAKPIQGQTEDTAVNQAIKQLWSADEDERALGVKNLLSYGDKSIKPLLALLNDILENRSVRRYATGKEEEAREISENYERLRANGNRKEASEAISRLAKLEVSRRLITWSISLLAQLKAEEAIPVFIKFLQCCEPEPEGLREPTGSGMQALIDMGSVAVPKLIEVLESPEGRKKIRVIIVLREIGDIRAIPALENLKRTITDPYYLRIIDRALSQLKQKSDTK
jgi:HEAT repeat protein